MVKENSFAYNMNKALEESTEFSEVILKLQTKSASHPKRPPLEESIKEYGDFVYRGFVSLASLHKEMTFEEIKAQVNNHIDYKLRNLLLHYQNKTYIGEL